MSTRIPFPSTSHSNNNHTPHSHTSPKSLTHGIFTSPDKGFSFPPSSTEAVEPVKEIRLGSPPLVSSPGGTSSSANGMAGTRHHQQSGGIAPGSAGGHHQHAYSPYSLAARNHGHNLPNGHGSASSSTSSLHAAAVQVQHAGRSTSPPVTTHVTTPINNNHLHINHASVPSPKPNTTLAHSKASSSSAQTSPSVISSTSAGVTPRGRGRGRTLEKDKGEELDDGRKRERTITGRSVASREDAMSSMADIDGDVSMDVDMDGHVSPSPPAHTGPTGRRSSKATLGQAAKGRSEAPVSSSSSSSAVSKKEKDSVTKDRDSGYTRQRSATISALTDSNSREVNGARADEVQGMTTRSAAKGKGRDYGDRFIPQRDGSDLQSSYRLMPEHVTYNTGAGSGGIFGGDAGYMAAYQRSLGVGGIRRGVGGEVDNLKDEANRAYSHLLQTELFGSSGSSDRPVPSHSASAPAISSRPAHSGLASSSMVHGHYAAGTGALPPLPSHAPTTPTSTTTSAFATTARGGASATGGGTRMYHSGYATSPGPGSAPPSTPSRKRMFTFSSPQGSGRSSPSGSGRSSGAGVAVSPGTFGLGHGIGTGVGVGLDDMMHDKYSLSPIGKESQRALMSPRKSVRWISKTPFKVLDAPDLADDFYLNLVSWSNSNILGVGLASCVYLWSAHTSKVTKLCDLADGARPNEPQDSVTGLEWTNRGSTMAIGTNKGVVEIWDTEKCKKIRTLSGHSGRVGALAWNEHILSTGSRDRLIYHRDVRAPSQYIRELKGHRQEVCGLRWNTTTDQLASGGNDNKLFVWEKTSDLPLYRFSEHCAAVKAITWSPHQRGILASGGGTADKKIRFWNALTGTMLSEWDTGSQVCNLMWSKNSNELVSTHGYSGGAVSNQICVWRYPSMSQIATLSGHTFRVLYLAMSPDGQTIVTGAGDETLRFWNAFQKRRTGEAAAIGVSDAAGSGSDAIREESVLNPFARIR